MTVGDLVEVYHTVVAHDCFFFTCQTDGLFFYSECSATCVYDQWSEWTPCPMCSDSLNQTQTRTRSLIFDRNMTHGCGQIDREQQLCPFTNCSCINDYNCTCLLSEWTEWTSCSQSCGLGKRTRHRSYITRGLWCENVSLTQNEDCNEQCCPGNSYFINF